MKKLVILIGVMLVLALIVTPASAIMGEGFDATGNNLVVAGDPEPAGMAISQSECTLGINHASITTHDSPVLWRVRDNPDKWLIDWPEMCYSVQHYSKDDYDEIELDYIATVHYIDEGPFKIHGFGLNEAGVGTGETLVKNDNYDVNNLWFTYEILGNVRDMDEVREYLKTPAASTYNPSGCWGFIDNYGNASMFELDPSSEEDYWEYNTMDEDRIEQGLQGFVVRANEHHKNDDGTDDTDVMFRYQIGTENTLGLIAAGELNEQSAVQSDSNNEYRLIRQNDIPWPISNGWSRDAAAIRAAAPGEDPALATMWALLGNPSFSIAVPTWVAVSDIPEPIGTCAMHTAVTTLFENSQSIAGKKIDAEWVQTAVLPAEAHLFDMVNNRILPHWRTLEGPPAVEEMTRIEHQMTADAYSVVNFLAITGDHNLAPTIDFKAKQKADFTYRFTANAADSDGSVVSYSWNFGDGITSTYDKPEHKFPGAGVYLVSVTVADDDGVTTTTWRYLTVPAP